MKFVILALGVLLLFGISPSYSASPSAGKNIIVQHVYVIPRTGHAVLSVYLSLPVTSGDMLVVGVVFGSADTGSVTDALSNSFLDQQQNRTTVSFPGSSDLGTGIWWTTSKSSGNDTVRVRSLNSTELVEVFEIAGANASTVGLGSGGGYSPDPGIGGVTAGQEVHDGTAFVMVVGGSANGSQDNATCYPLGPIDYTPAQSPGFIIEPYCGTASPFTGGLLLGEYGIGNNTGSTVCHPSGNSSTCTTSGTAFTADLGVNPPLAGDVLGQAFWVDPTTLAPAQTTTITTVASRSTSSQSATPTATTLTTAITVTRESTSQTTPRSTSSLTTASTTSTTSTSTRPLQNGPPAISGYMPYVVAGVVGVGVAVLALASLLRRRGR